MGVAAVVFISLALGLLLAMNRGMFAELGWAGTLRLLLIWGVIFAVLVAVVDFVGVPERFRQ